MHRGKEIKDKMILNYKDCFWGDSILRKIEISDDMIEISIYNDAFQKNIFIDCLKCAGMTEIINWDENIVENIFVKEIVNGCHSIISKIKQLYGDNSYDCEKCIEEKFFELNVVLINGISFSVICQNIEFRD